MKFFSTQCQGIRPHLAARGKSHGFSRVASGTWDVFSRDGGDGPSKAVCVKQHQDSSLLTRDRLGFSSRHQSAIGSLVKGSWRPKVTYYLPQGYWDSCQLSRGVSHFLILKHLSPHDSRCIKGLYASCRNEAGNKGCLYGYHSRFRHPYIL